MPAQPEFERDSFDQWIGHVLMAGCQAEQPSEQVWQRITHRIERLSLHADQWAGQKHARSFGLLGAWSEPHECPAGLSRAGMGIIWAWLYPKPLPFA